MFYFDKDHLKDDLSNYLNEKGGFTAITIRLRSGKVLFYNNSGMTAGIVEIIRQAIYEKLHTERRIKNEQTKKS